MSKWLKLVLSLVISAVGLYYAFGQVNFNELWFHLKSVNVLWMSVATLLLVFSVAIRAERWQMLLEPIENIQFRSLFGATMVGYFGNAVLPFRLGELLRAYSISENHQVDTSAAFGTIILERILDLLGLVSTIILFGWLFPFDTGGRNIMIAVVVVTLLGFGFIMVLGSARSHLMDRIEKWPIFEKPFAHRLLTIMNSLVDGLTSIRATKHVGQIVIHTIFMWVVYYSITYTVILATGINISWIEVGVVLISTSLAVAIPAAPGAVGTYHAAAVYVLTVLFSVGSAESQAFAILLHAVGFIPLIIIGFIYFLNSSVHIRDISKQHIVE
ncbi:MAG: flippase-like domain-containing protein [Candidatus Marinimicrobia bacterium]|nr:flippase-like domain-containing protein [Candidatus Neomarinimicrobiota bacterium]MBL7010350.1 flippase-like domain-containing protein [Candidatus Neomarinimicrobiota bacterium]MBL7030022.1 flippase-like domain-containing protein [Candidatus Neomarinimicrobiota bacterium]